MKINEQIIRQCATETTTRFEFWIRFLQEIKVKKMVEVGVYGGEYASQILKECDSIKKYYMIDPWKHLPDLNRPTNPTDEIFELVFVAAKEKTNFAFRKRNILRGRTTEVIHKIPDHSLDFAYIDADHTLRGITIDLIKVYPKIKNYGWIGGDDFSETIWHHPPKYEPCIVFPFAVYFAEAMNERIYALPNDQFLIEKNPKQSFEFVDLVGDYSDITLNHQLIVYVPKEE